MRFSALCILSRFSFRFFSIIIVFVSLYALIAPVNKIYAQNYQQQTNNQYLTPDTNPDVQHNLHIYTQSVVIELLSSAVCSISGINLFGSQQGCLGIDARTGKLGYTTKTVGLANFFANGIGQLYISPIHSVDYVNYVADNFIPTKKALAATTGIGFNGLHSFIGIWTAFRNISYLGFVLVFVVLGIGIILRLKVGNSVMSVQNILPKAIIGIVLVTFSYAIAGFMIDIMYILTYLVVYVMAPLDSQNGNPFPLDTNQIFSGLNRPPAEMVDKLYNIGPFQLGLLYIPFRASLGLATLMSGMLTDIISGNGFAKTLPITWFFLILFGVIFNFPCFASHISIGLGGIGWPTYENLTQCATDAIIPIAAAIIFLILYIMLLWVLFKVWFELIKCYALFLIDVLMGPFRAAYKPVDWIRSMASHLLPFPVVLFMFLLSKLLIDTLNPNDGSLFYPPMVGNLSTQSDARIFGFSLGKGPSFIGAIAGFGMILLAPSAIAMSQEITKAVANKYVGSSIGQAVQTGTGLATQLIAPPMKKLWDPGGPNRDVGYLRQKVQGKPGSFMRKIIGNPYHDAEGIQKEGGKA